MARGDCARRRANRGRRCVRDATLRNASLFLNTPPSPVRVDSCHATSGRFCRKWALILPWVLGFCAVFRRRRPPSTSLTWGNAVAARPFGLNPPAKPPRSRKRASHSAASCPASPPRSHRPRRDPIVPAATPLPRQLACRVRCPCPHLCIPLLDLPPPFPYSESGGKTRLQSFSGKG